MTYCGSMLSMLYTEFDILLSGEAWRRSGIDVEHWKLRRSADPEELSSSFVVYAAVLCILAYAL